MGDIFTFIVIGIIVYSLFSRKDRPPRRSSQPPRRSSQPPRPSPVRTENYQQSVEKTNRPPKINTPETKKQDYRRVERQSLEPAAGLDWPLYWESEEGYSDYGKYPSSEGTQGVEGTKSLEGSAGDEGFAGDEGSAGYQTKLKQAEQALIKEDQAPSDQPKLEPVLSFSAHDVVRGVIWAEILKRPGERGVLSRKY
ncbi:MAG: hypothetical protein GX248_00560 [Peptococcaceae bacterium]|nr:hypothetical protein [Peptococcaceae bacterium]